MTPWAPALEGSCEKPQAPADFCFPTSVCLQHDLHLSELLTQTLPMERPRLGTAAVARGGQDGDDGDTQLAETEWNGTRVTQQIGPRYPCVSVVALCAAAFTVHTRHGSQSPSEHRACQLVPAETLSLWRCSYCFLHLLH